MAVPKSDNRSAQIRIYTGLHHRNYPRFCDDLMALLSALPEVG